MLCPSRAAGSFASGTRRVACPPRARPSRPPMSLSALRRPLSPFPGSSPQLAAGLVLRHVRPGLPRPPHRSRARLLRTIWPLPPARAPRLPLLLLSPPRRSSMASTTRPRARAPAPSPQPTPASCQCSRRCRSLTRCTCAYCTQSGRLSTRTSFRGVPFSFRLSIVF